MPNFTYALQKRVATVTDRVAKYQISMEITDRGDLPDKGVFLKEIVSENDPKEDRLERVCRSGDLVTYSTSREEAIRKLQPYWRDASLTKFYDTVDQASVAAEFLKERVNDLTEEYTKYLDEFKADPAEEISFPQTDLGIFQPLIKDYTEKVDERKAQEEELEAKKDECADIEDRYEDATNAAQRAQQALDALNKARSTLSDVRSTMQSQYDAARAVGSDISAALDAWNDVREDASGEVQSAMDASLEDPTGALYDEYHGSFKDKVTELKQAITELDSQISDIDSKVAEQTSRHAEAVAERDQLLEDKEKCATEKVEAQATLDALERAEADLLDEITELCPSYTP